MLSCHIPGCSAFMESLVVQYSQQGHTPLSYITIKTRSSMMRWGIILFIYLICLCDGKTLGRIYRVLGIHLGMYTFQIYKIIFICCVLWLKSIMFMLLLSSKNLNLHYLPILEKCWIFFFFTHEHKVYKLHFTEQWMWHLPNIHSTCTGMCVLDYNDWFTCSK